MKIMIPQNVRVVLNKLRKDGYAAYIVGGCVRDSLLGKIPNDFDITTNAQPTEVKSCFSGFTVIPTGEKHGTIGVMVEDELIEVTTYRIEDEYTDNRHPDKVTFVTSLKQDLSRRDLTINALAYSEFTGVIDYFHGLEDLEARVVRAVGYAKDRFEEDALRILRVIRFAAALDFTMERSTKEAVFSCAPLLGNISVERVREEFFKILASEHARAFITEYLKVLAVPLPEIKCADTSLILKTSDINIRLALLFPDESLAVSALTRLKCDNKRICDVTFLCRYAKEKIAFEIDALKIIRAIGEPLFERLIEIKKIYGIGVACAEKAYGRVKCGETIYDVSQLAVNGRDLMKLGINAGKRLGEVKEKLLAGVTEGRLNNDAETLLNAAKEML